MSETKATYTTGRPPDERALRLAAIERKARAKALALASLDGEYAASEVAFATDVRWLLGRLATAEAVVASARRFEARWRIGTGIDAPTCDMADTLRDALAAYDAASKEV